MNETAKLERRRLQFGIRRLLLWTTVVALACGMLSSLGPEDVLDWTVLPTWFVTVFIVRWAFGSKWAAVVSIMAGMFLCLGWAIYRPKPLGMVGLATGSVLLGTLLGCVPFLMVEAACRTVDWIDRIRQSDE